MKNPLATRLEELIENTSDKQFDLIYQDYRNYRKKHFVEFGLMKSMMPLVEDLSDIMEEQQIFRNKLKKKSMQISRVAEEVTEEPEEPVEQITKKETPKETESWEAWWKQQSPPPPSRSNGFGKIFAYVVGAHVCIISFISLNTWMNTPSAPQMIEQKVSAPVAPDMPKYVAGPLSDALSRR